ncbi:MAG TPA: hypothetical protein VGR55_10125 [Candidatus Acidoferrum sp.]|nr:hypothetical protein [Candidatus Acidoferrum sp.]
MNVTFYFFLAIVGILLVLFVWSLRSPKRYVPSTDLPFPIQEDLQSSPVSHLPQIRRALAATDFEFASKRIPRDALRQMRRERRQVTLAYLSALRAEMDQLLRTARVIAALSPEVAAGQELERVLLMVKFLGRYRMVQMSVWAGFTPLPQLSDLSDLLSGYSVRLEEAMKEMGERAALVAEMVSSPDRRRIHPV